jgi:hypothetical protein
MGVYEFEPYSKGSKKWIIGVVFGVILAVLSLVPWGHW